MQDQAKGALRYKCASAEGGPTKLNRPHLFIDDRLARRGEKGHGQLRKSGGGVIFEVLECWSAESARRTVRQVRSSISTLPFSSGSS